MERLSDEALEWQGKILRNSSLINTPILIFVLSLRRRMREIANLILILTEVTRLDQSFAYASSKRNVGLNISPSFRM